MERKKCIHGFGVKARWKDAARKTYTQEGG
jgi:hypothetical protein